VRHSTSIWATLRPDLVPLYRRLYPRGYAPRAYVEGLRECVDALRSAHGLQSTPPRLLPAQLAFAW
jgi:hypothetical protein